MNRSFLALLISIACLGSCGGGRAPSGGDGGACGVGDCATGAHCTSQKGGCAQSCTCTAPGRWTCGGCDGGAGNGGGGDAETDGASGDTAIGDGAPDGGDLGSSAAEAGEPSDAAGTDAPADEPQDGGACGTGSCAVGYTCQQSFGGCLVKCACVPPGIWSCAGCEDGGAADLAGEPAPADGPSARDARDAPADSPADVGAIDGPPTGCGPTGLDCINPGSTCTLGCERGDYQTICRCSAVHAGAVGGVWICAPVACGPDGGGGDAGGGDALDAAPPPCGPNGASCSGVTQRWCSTCDPMSDLATYCACESATSTWSCFAILGCASRDPGGA